MATRTIAEVEAEIAEVRAAISALVKGGQNYTINSGGSIRTVTQVDMKSLRTLLVDLNRELAELENSADTQGIVIGANW